MAEQEAKDFLTKDEMLGPYNPAFSAIDLTIGDIEYADVCLNPDCGVVVDVIEYPNKKADAFGQLEWDLGLFEKTDLSDYWLESKEIPLIITD